MFSPAAHDTPREVFAKMCADFGARLVACNGEDDHAHLLMVEVVTAGVHVLPKVSAQVWAAGDVVFWDDNLKLCTATAAGITRIGIAAAAAGKPSSRGRVRPDGML